MRGGGWQMCESTRLTAAAKEVREFAKIGLRDDSTQRRIRLLERAPILRNLPAVKAAGEDSTPQFEYLVQAIIDVIDSIDGQVGAANLAGSEEITTSRRLEADALRTLFGLTEHSRRATWQKRQGDAARTLSISWEHFRKKTQGALLCVIAEQLLLTVDTKGHAPQSFLLDGNLMAFGTQADIEEDVVAYIRQSSPRRAVLLELSTATIGPILLALRDVDAHIRLLVSNPYKATAMWHQERIWMTLVGRLQRDFKGYDGLDMRIYDVPPRLRGRLIGDLIALGWYTTRDNKRLESMNPAATEVWGHDNAFVAGNASRESGQILASWFKREFDRLWHHRLTVGGSEMMRLLGLDL